MKPAIWDATEETSELVTWSLLSLDKFTSIHLAVERKYCENPPALAPSTTYNRAWKGAEVAVGPPHLQAGQAEIRRRSSQERRAGGAEDRGNGLFLRFTPGATAQKNRHGAAHPTDVFITYFSVSSGPGHAWSTRTCTPIIIKLWQTVENITPSLN